MRFPLLPDRPWTLLVIAVAGYCAILVCVYFRQEKILYFPDVYPLASAASRAKALHFRPWPEHALDYHGFVQADGPTSPKGVILLFHGNAGTAPDRFFYAQELGQLGDRLILFEYPGYGARGSRTIWRSAGSAGRIVGVRHSGCGGGFETGSGRRSGIDYPLGYAARHGAVRLLVSPRKMDDPGSVRQRLQPERIRRAGGSGGGGKGRRHIVRTRSPVVRTAFREGKGVAVAGGG